MTAELLGFAAAGVSDEEGLVVLEEEFLELTLAGLVVVLLVEGNNRLGNSLADGQNLAGGTTTLDAAADVQVLEAVGTEEENGLPDLHAEGNGLEQLDGLSVDLDGAVAGGGVRDGGGVLLAAEALH